MALPISNDARTFLQSYRHQKVEMVIAPTNTETTYTIGESKVWQGGLVVNRKSASGNTLGFGACIASELSLVLNNDDGYFNDIKLEGARINAYLLVGDGPNYETVRIGYFTVDGCPKKRSRIELNALDDMVTLDTLIPVALFDAFPKTAVDTLTWISTRTGISINTTGLVNTDYMIYAVDEMYEGITYRQLLSWVCQIVGANAFVDPNGVIQVKWYERTTPVTGLSPLIPSIRSDFEYEDYDIELTGIKYVDTDGVEYSVNFAGEGQSTYNIEIDNNPLITYNPNSVISNLSTLIYEFKYRPFSANIVPSPQLYPMDMFNLTIGNDDDIMTVVTGMTFKINADTKVESVGESATSAGYAAMNPMTGQEAAVVAKLKKDSEESFTGEIQRTLAFSELISNALGLYYTADEQIDGSYIYYLHNGVSLETSTVIFTINAGGIAWTDDWNDGNPSWTQGVSSAGDAFFRFISAKGLNLSDVDDPYHIEITPGTFTVYYGSGATEQVVATIKADETNGSRATTMQIPRVLISNYQEIGPIRMVAKTDGLDFVYVGS